MGIRYENLDDRTRQFMLQEAQLGDHYMSPPLTNQGKAAWPSLIEEGIKSHDDDWVAREILRRGASNGRGDRSEDGRRNVVDR
jgi:hypothetical protein